MSDDPGIAWESLYCLRPYNSYRLMGTKSKMDRKTETPSTIDVRSIAIAKLEGAFFEELRRLQPTAGYMKLVKERVLQIWRDKQAEIQCFQVFRACQRRK